LVSKATKNSLNFNILGYSSLLSLIETKTIVDPFDPELLSINGLDLRLANEYVRLKNARTIFDTHRKNLLRQFFSTEKSSSILIKPHDQVLTCTIERFRMPSNIIGLVGLRSTYSRLGLHMPLGFVDPGFVGQLTLEVSGGSFPILLHEGEKVFRIMFASLNQNETYNGKYQNQKGVVLPIFGES
jgi:dCTP deaminase